jgi:hypothetical protein
MPLAMTFTRSLIALAVTLSMLVCARAFAEAGESDGDRLARRAYEVNSGKDSFSRLKFTFEERGKTTGSELVMGYRRGSGELDYKVIMFNRYPPDRKDVGFLGWFYRPGAGKEDDMWLYLPELRLVRRMVHHHHGGSMEGEAMDHEEESDEFSISQLNHEELMPRWPGLDDNRLLGTTQLDGRAVDMVESKPRDPATSEYGKRIQWLTREEGLPVKVEYYDEDMMLLKTQTLTWRRVDDAWVWDRVTAVSNVTGAKTVLEQTDVRIGLGLPDSLFSKRALSLGAKAFESRVEKYR